MVVFPTDDGWVVQIPERFQNYMKIQLINRKWSADVAITLMGRRDFFNTLQIGVMHKQTSQNRTRWKRLSSDIIAIMKLKNTAVKQQSGGWPAFFYLAELGKTGGHNWKYISKESQETFAAAVVQAFAQWSLVIPNLDSYALPVQSD